MTTTNTINFKLSKHARKDRLNRLCNLVTYFGLGEKFDEVNAPKERGDVRYIVTTTGVMLVVNNTDDILITAYLLNREKANAMYHSLGDKVMPTALHKIILRNENKIRHDPKLATLIDWRL